MIRPLILTALPLTMLGGCTIIPAGDPARGGYAAPEPPPPRFDNATGNAEMDNAQPLPSQPQPEARPESAYSPMLTYAASSQSVTVDGPRITPLAILEDSRCPTNARCVWAGHVRVKVRIDSGRGGEIEMTSNKPVTVADGQLELVDVTPAKTLGQAGQNSIAPKDYRFGFRFIGGY